jgi:cysteine desulfurase
MLPWFQFPANPHARHHVHGAAAERAVSEAQNSVANAVNARPEEIIFTSGATEANNLAVHGISDYLLSKGKTHIIASALEHSSVLQAINCIDGFTVTMVPPKPCGMVEASTIDPYLTEKTGLVCLQAVNNETGTVQPVKEVAALLAGRDILLHCDAAQAIGKIPFDVVSASVDFASMSAHKVHGPQGIGALYLRAELQKEVVPLLRGGGQQKNLRSGTLPTALCVGFGKACDILEINTASQQALRHKFLGVLKQLGPVVYGHADEAWQVPGILALRFPGIDSEALVMALPEVSFGTGAACSSSRNEYSHVISAIAGVEAARECVRISFSRMTSRAEVEEAAGMIQHAVSEMYQSR